GKGVRVFIHAVDRVLQVWDLPADVDGAHPGEVSLGDGRRHLRDIAHVRGEVACHEIDVVGEVFPDPGHALDLGLAAQLAFGTDFARDARDFRGEGVELIDHDVDGVLQLGDLAVDIDRDLLGKIAASDGGRDLRDVAHLIGQVVGHRVDVVGKVFPGPGGTQHVGLAAQPAFGTHLPCHATDFRGEGVQLVDHDIDGVLQLEDLALHFDGDLLGEIALLHGGGDVGDIAHLRRQVARHEVHVVGEVLPDTADAAHLRLAAELALGANLAGHAGDFRGEGVELIDHGVDGVVELQDLAANVDRDLLRHVAPGDGGRDVGDVAHLGRDVRGDPGHDARGRHRHPDRDVALSALA